MDAPEQIQQQLIRISEFLRRGETAQAANIVNALHPADIANILESLPREDRARLWEAVNPDLDGDVLLCVNDEVRSGLIRHMDTDELVAATEGLDTDDLADILPDLPETVINELLQSLEEQDRHRLEAVLQYPDDTAGGMMNIDTTTVRPDVTLDVVLRYLRRRGQLPEMTDSLFVVDRDDKFLGALPLTALLTQNPLLTVEEVYSRAARGIPAEMPANEVTRVFERRDLVSAAVIDQVGKLVGRITIDDVVDVIRDEASHSVMRLAGLNDEDDMFAPVVRSSRKRAVWLGINLVTALLASWVIGLFELTIEKVVALAVLMPVVASMGGIAGSQTLTLVIRGMALGQVTHANAMKLLAKEVKVGALNGLLWSVVIGLVSYGWFGSAMIGVIIGMAILCNLIVAAIAGATIPLTLKRFGADPALAGGVVLTTITDVVGFFTFLGLGTLLLM